jgi:phytol kinase
MKDFSYRQELYRKSIHLASLWMPLSLLLLGKGISILLFLIALGFVLFFEHIRRQDNAIGRMACKLLGLCLRPEEVNGTVRFTGATPMLVGAILVAMFAPVAVAATALTILVVADTAAALVGRKWGRYKLLDKSWEGTGAFLITSYLVILGIAALSSEFNTRFIATALLAAPFAAAAELYSKRFGIDDNLSIPLVFAIVQMMFAGF